METKTNNPTVIKFSIGNNDLINSIVTRARKEGEADYCYWLRKWIKENIGGLK